MSYHASGKPVLRTGSVIIPPPKIRVTRAYGDGVSATPYKLESASGWSPRLLRDVESRYAGKRAAREARRHGTGQVRSNMPAVARADVQAAKRAHERAIAGNIGNVE